MAKTLFFPELNASFSEHPVGSPAGLLVSQNGRSYYARRHLLSDEVVAIINAAVDAGLTAFWKQGHPGDAYFSGGDRFGTGAHQIQFSKTHDTPWTFVIGAENKPPRPSSVTFKSKLKPILDRAAQEKGLNSLFEYQVVGGKNITVEIDKLAFALAVCVEPEVQAFLAERAPRRIPTPRCPAFVSEDDLQAAISSKLLERGFRVEREVRLPAGRIDLIAVSADRHLIIEVKPHSTGRAVFDQIDRYHRGYQALTGQPQRRVEPILIARHFQTDLITHVSNVASPVKLVRYDVTTDGELTFTALGEPDGMSTLVI